MGALFPVSSLAQASLKALEVSWPDGQHKRTCGETAQMVVDTWAQPPGDPRHRKGAKERLLGVVLEIRDHGLKLCTEQGLWTHTHAPWPMLAPSVLPHLFFFAVPTPSGQPCLLPSLQCSEQQDPLTTIRAWGWDWGSWSNSHTAQTSSTKGSHGTFPPFLGTWVLFRPMPVLLVYTA